MCLMLAVQAISVFVLYVICTACDPADPGVHEAKLLRKLEAALPKLNSPVSKKNDQGGLIEQESAGQEEPIRSLRACLAVAEVAEGEATGEKKNCCNPNFKAALKVLQYCRAWKFREADDSLKPEEQEWFYCRLCDAKVSIVCTQTGPSNIYMYAYWENDNCLEVRSAAERGN